ncbi:Crp/Fnr family transcriptional regulator [uncultured Croceitalea sp.]|uniref:Crp/Fnr family transcriptional regulator n=1 Tax=uncultured Croceitalea sp. TaxID=1798908 RepID=UPI00330640FE
MIRTNENLLEYISWLEKHSSYSIGGKIFKPKQLILEQNHRYNTVFIIRKGIVKCYLSDENGKEFIQEFLGQGMEFGELEVFNQKPTICSVSAVVELQVFTMSHSVFKNLLEKDAKFNKIVMSSLADKIRYKAPRHSYQQSYPIEDNFLRLKQVFPEITEVLSKQDISNYMGITTRSLNRVLQQLEGNLD